MPEGQEHESKLAARAAVRMALSLGHEEERQIKAELAAQGIAAAAVDCGGEFLLMVHKTIERAVVAAKREGVIRETHADEGAVAGAAHEALTQVGAKAQGLNVGGKVGIARSGEHLVVAVFFELGLLHLDDIVLGLAHRALAGRPAAVTGAAKPAAGTVRGGV